jgi:hypothetical protein
VKKVAYEHLGGAISLASCGIAYAMRYIRAAAEGGVELGFYPQDATEIVCQTVKGAAALIEAHHSHPEVEIDKVTTPGGLTIKGLNAMEDAGAYRYYKTTTGPWTITENVSMKQGLQDEDWDIITMQQSSPNSGLADTYEPFMTDLVNFVNENKTNPDAKLFWHMTWAYQSDSTHAPFANYGNNQIVLPLTGSVYNPAQGGLIIHMHQEYAALLREGKEQLFLFLPQKVYQSVMIRDLGVQLRAVR